MHTGQVSPAVLKPSSSDAFFNKGSRQESVSPPVAAVLPFGRNASHNTGRHTRGGNVHTRATHVDTRDEAEMTPKELARNPLGARSYTHNAPSYTGGAPSAASSDIEAASRAEAETEPKVIARRAPTYDIPLRSPEPVFFLDPPVSLEYNQSIGSEPSQTFVKSPTTGSEPSDPPDSLKEKPDQSFVSYPYDSSRAERAPNAPPTLTIDDIEDAYMSTTSIGSDADETIPGYYGDATSNRTVRVLVDFSTNYYAYQKLMREKHTRFSPRFYPQIAIYNQLYLCSYSYHSLPTGIITKCVLSSVEYNYNIFG